jgi:hypothetical protein
MAADDISIGDNVRIVRSELTAALGHADEVGVCHGFATPSVTGVEVIGDSSDDMALAVHFGDDGMDEVWFAPDLVQFVDHAAGSRATVGDQEFVRADDGSWVPVGERSRQQGPRRRWFRRT